MICNFIRKVVSPLFKLGCSEELQKAKIGSGVHGDHHSRRFEVPPPTSPAPSYHLSDNDIRLSSTMDQHASVCCGQMLSRFGRATLEDIPEEVRCHILSFLSCNEIIRCALTCQTMYTTVKSSIELQYTIELGAQKLIQVHPRPPTVSTAECLCILRDKANAWNSFEINTTKTLCSTRLFESNSVAHQQLICSDSTIVEDASSDTVDIQTYTTCIAQVGVNRLNPGLRTFRYIDDMQDLEITIKFPIDVDVDTYELKYQILFHTLSTGEEHPLSHGSRVITGGAACSEALEIQLIVSVHGDRLAVYIAELDENCDSYWSLHVWSWHQGAQADDVCVVGKGNELSDVNFFTKEKVLALSSDGHIELYDVEDLSKAPQLQARFILPVHTELGVFHHPSVFHSAASCAHLAIPDDNWIWTTNPADRVISVVWAFPSSVFVISARIFFMDIHPTWFDATSKDGRSIPWSSWGPQNSRYFPEEMLGREGLRSLGMGGSRVIWAVPVAGNDSFSQFHVADFNPSAVARGMGNVVREPTISTGLKPDIQVTTYLPFVEVVRKCVIHGSLWDIVLDEEGMVVLTRPEIESEWKMQANFFDM
ncbi:uncharacterized protein EDB91DRAFT_878106 [Suillus paluster]|uniref:uncharacterized protein n=1 Tax=Suillus paluster TaxID=48578 RepID=UPI001B877C70|nr:uncharacterized protein EDB91DRAFT_878106 [Suillus paluster]KAG1748404.1 hypothetical protein EDB91DRAFT_878106 [Suillus paluster]